MSTSGPVSLARKTLAVDANPCGSPRAVSAPAAARGVVVVRLLLVWSVAVACLGLGVAASLEPDAGQSVAATGDGNGGNWSSLSPTESALIETAEASMPDAALSALPNEADASSPPTPAGRPEAASAAGAPASPPTAPPFPGTVEGSWAPQATSAGVHLVDLDSGHVRQLAGPGSFRGLPSPNGRRIAYVASVDASFRYRVEIAEVGSGAVEVLAEALDGSVIGWAPDNRSLLVATRTPGADDPAMTEARLLTPGGGTRLVSPVGVDANPVGWSPTTNLIAYQAPDGTHVVRPDGTDDRLVLPWDDGDHRQRFASEWSPVGPELLFAEVDMKVDAQMRPRNDHRIFALNPTTGVQRDLAKPVAPPGYALWSSDGRGLCYSTDDEGGRLAWTNAGATGQIAHELDSAGAGSELVAIRPSQGDGPREVVSITPGGTARTVLGAHDGDTYWNIAGVPGTRLAVVDIAPEAFYR